MDSANRHDWEQHWKERWQKGLAALRHKGLSIYQAENLLAREMSRERQRIEHGRASNG